MNEVQPDFGIPLPSINLLGGHGGVDCCWTFPDFFISIMKSNRNLPFPESREKRWLSKLWSFPEREILTATPPHPRLQCGGKFQIRKNYESLCIILALSGSRGTNP